MRKIKRVPQTSGGIAEGKIKEFKLEDEGRKGERERFQHCCSKALKLNFSKFRY